MISSGWSRGGMDRHEGSNEPVQHPRPAESSQLERERVCSANFRLELYLVKRRRDPFHAGIAELIKVIRASSPRTAMVSTPATPPRNSQKRHREECFASAGIGPKRSRTSVRSASMSLGSVIAVNRR